MKSLKERFREARIDLERDDLSTSELVAHLSIELQSMFDDLKEEIKEENRALKSGLESLCDEREQEVYAGIPEDYKRRGIEENYLNMDNYEAGMMECVDRVRSLLGDE